MIKNLIIVSLVVLFAVEWASRSRAVSYREQWIHDRDNIIQAQASLILALEENLKAHKQVILAQGEAGCSIVMPAESGHRDISCVGRGCPVKVEAVP